MSKKFTHLDADESVFFARELESVKSKTYDIKYAGLQARTIIPVSFEAGPGADTIKYEQWDQVGVAKIVSNYATDIPRVDVKAKEFRSPVKSLADSYGYSIQDVRSAKQAGKPLEARKAAAAKRGILQAEHAIAMFGNADHGLQGLLSHPNVPVVVIPADGTGASKKFSTKTADKIIRDINSIVNAPINNTKGVEIPDTMLFPVDVYTLISSTPWSATANSDTTILEFVKKANPHIKEWGMLPDLKDAGGAGVDQALCYRRDPNALTLEIPQDFEQFAPQEKGLAFEIPCHSRCGGVIIYYPLSLAKADSV